MVAKKPKKIYKSSDGRRCRPIFLLFFSFFCRRVNNSKTERKEESGAHLFCVLQQPCCMLGPWVPIQQRLKGNKDVEAIESCHCIHSFTTGEEKSNKINLKISIVIIIIILNLVINISMRCTFKTLQKF